MYREWLAWWTLFPTIFVGTNLGFIVVLLFHDIVPVLWIALSGLSLLWNIIKKLFRSQFLLLNSPFNYIIFKFADAVIGSSLSEWINEIILEININD